MSGRGIIVTFLICVYLIESSMQQEYTSWKLPGSPRTDLLCPVYCAVSCCACQAISSWIQYGTRYSRMLELYIDNQNIYLKEPELHGGLDISTSNNSTYDEIAYVNSNIRRIPDNVCDFPNIMTINFMYNIIENISDISCLKNLDTLNLSRNRIKILMKATFVQNRNLRVLDLSYNMIFYLEPGAIQSFTTSSVYLNNNLIPYVDFIDVILDKPFCEIHFQFNKIVKVKNEMGFHIDLSPEVTYGPGYVDGSNNDILLIPDLGIYGIGDLLSWSKLIYLGFDIRKNKLLCDCRLVKILIPLRGLFQIMSRTYFDVKCYYPSHLRGVSILSIARSESLFESLLCNYTSSQSCPIGCHCYQYFPYSETAISSDNLEDRLVVNCTGNMLETMPEKVPDAGKEKYLLFAGNLIKNLQYKNYLRDVSILDLSFNKLNKISKKAVNALRIVKSILLTGNSELANLPTSFANLNPCVILSESDVILNKCGCNDFWIVQWLNTYDTSACNSTAHLKCRTNTGMKLATEYFRHISCKQNVDSKLPQLVASFGGIISFLLVAFLIYRQFRYELQICLRFLKKRDDNTPLNHDIYVSFDDSDTNMRKWVLNSLTYELETDGYLAFVPIRDMEFATVRNEEMIMKVSKSKNFVVIPSASYFGSDQIWTKAEWNTIWNIYINNSDRQLVVLNYDFLTADDNVSRKLKALMRFRKVLDFSNRTNTIPCKIKDIVGRPMISEATLGSTSV